MKHTTYTLPILLLLLLTLPQRGTGQNTSEKLVGTWAFDYESSLREMAPDIRAYFDRMDAGRKDLLIKSYRGRQVTFGGDGTFVQTSPDGQEVHGTWRLVSDAEKVEVSYPDGMVYPQRIEQLTGNRLVLVPEDIGKGKLFFKEWHFVKN